VTKSKKKGRSRAGASKRLGKLGQDVELTFRELEALKREGQAFQRANPPKSEEEAEGRLLLKPSTVRHAKVRWPKA
jgi:hypothetical protein